MRGAVPQTEWSQTTRTDRKPDVETREGDKVNLEEVCFSEGRKEDESTVKKQLKRKVKIAWGKNKIKTPCK